LKTAKGEFVAIFDADFVPPPDFLLKCIHHFTDPKIGMVQTRWTHINRNYSLLTQVEAILLDGHFVLEHSARRAAASSSTSTAPPACGGARPSTKPAAGSMTRSPKTPIFPIARSSRDGNSFICRTSNVPAELAGGNDRLQDAAGALGQGLIQVSKKILPQVFAQRRIAAPKSKPGIT
jgi:hypothetical protein